MPRNRTGLLAQAEYLPLRGLLQLLRCIPLSSGQHMSRSLAQTLVACMPKRKRLVLAQLQACFPEKSASELETLAKGSIDHLGNGLPWFARMSSMTLQEFKPIVETQGFEHLDKALQQDRGVITFTAHYGCWELMANYVTRVYPKVAMTVRPLDNVALDAMVTGVRSSGGGQVIDSRKVLKEGIRLLRNNGILGVLIDQNFHKGGVFVNFFGRLAATNTLVPLLAHRTGCAVLPMHNIWRENKIRIICEPPVALSQASNPSQALAEDTQKLTSYVERWIREDPSQWLWLHNRWKRRPADGDTIYVEKTASFNETERGVRGA